MSPPSSVIQFVSSFELITYFLFEILNSVLYFLFLFHYLQYCFFSAPCNRTTKLQSINFTEILFYPPPFIGFLISFFYRNLPPFCTQNLNFINFTEIGFQNFRVTKELGSFVRTYVKTPFVYLSNISFYQINCSLEKTNFTCDSLLLLCNRCIKGPRFIQGS